MLLSAPLVAGEARLPPPFPPFYPSHLSCLMSGGDALKPSASSDRSLYPGALTAGHYPAAGAPLPPLYPPTHHLPVHYPPGCFTAAAYPVGYGSGRPPSLGLHRPPDPLRHHPQQPLYPPSLAFRPAPTTTTSPTAKTQPAAGPLRVPAQYPASYPQQPARPRPCYPPLPAAGQPPPAKRARLLEPPAQNGTDTPPDQDAAAVPAMPSVVNNEAPAPPERFHVGAVIELADGRRKRVEDLSTEDFLMSAEQTAELRVDRSVVTRIEEMDRTAARIVFTVGPQQTEVTVDARLDHPFFVFHRGWSSCCPELTRHRYSLPCRQLCVGDPCVSLAPRAPAANNANSNHVPTTGSNHRRSSR